jgi:membrane protein implicated in regulation of membrane protease activity
MIAERIVNLDAWFWIILGVVFIGIELFAPGIFFLWLGLAAMATGVVHGAAGLSWQASTLLFAILSILAVLLGRTLARKVDGSGLLNRRGEALVGTMFTLDQPISGGEGRVRVGDSFWRVTGADAPAGAAVRVVRLDGATLVVEKAYANGP